MSGRKLFALIFGVYLLLMSGHTYSPDEETLLATSVSLIERGTFALERNSTQVQVPGKDGQLFSQYGPGQPIAALPFVGAGLFLGDFILDLDPEGEGFVLRLIAGIFNPFIVAILCLLFWSTLQLLGSSRRLATALTLIFAFATYLWPHSRTFFGEPLTALTLLVVFYALLRARVALAGGAVSSTQRTFIIYGLVAGFFMAATLAVKLQYVVALPALGIYALWLVWNYGLRGQPASALRRATLLLLGGVVVGGLVGLGLLLLYNWSAFGSPLSSGYGTDLRSNFKTPLYEGLYGLLLSPGKGLWLYAPPLLLALLGWVAFFRRNRAETLVISFVALPVMLLFALYRFWPGDGAWGPRYMVPLLPFLLLPAAGLGMAAEQVPPVMRGLFRPPRRALLLFGALGLLVNFLGAAVNFDTYINVVNDDTTRYWYPYASPVRGHWVLLGQRVDEWRCRLLGCSDEAQLVSGFSYSEGDKSAGEILPRWTNGQPRIELPAAPVTVTLQLADHRPPPLPRAEIALSATGGQIVSQSRVAVPDVPVSSILTVVLRPESGRMVLAMDIPTWNPHEVSDSPRDEALGLLVEKMTVEKAGGSRVSIIEALPMAPMYPAPRWYYDTSSHHPLDWWGWYLYAAELPRGARVVALLIVVPALLAIVYAFVGVPFWRKRAL